MRHQILRLSLFCYYFGRYADITAVYLLFSYQTQQPLLILTLVSFVRSAPHVIFAPFMGIFVDRFSSSRYLIFVILIISGLILVSFFIDNSWVLLLLLLLRTLLRTAVQPGFMKFFRTHSSTKLMKKNIERLFADSMMSMVAPIMIGALVTIVSIKFAFVLSAGSYLIAAFAFQIVNNNVLAQSSLTPANAPKKISHEWFQVLKLIFQENRVIFLVLGSTLVGFIVALLRSVYPALAYQNHFSPFEYSLIISQYGAGTLVILFLNYKKLINARFYKKFYYSIFALSLGMGLTGMSAYSGRYLVINMLCWFAIGAGATLINLLQVVYMSRIFDKKKQASIHSTVNCFNGAPILLVPLIGLFFSSVKNMEILLIILSLLLFGFALFMVIRVKSHHIKIKAQS